jgi:hypothetical protein
MYLTLKQRGGQGEKVGIEILNESEGGDSDISRANVPHGCDKMDNLNRWYKS